MNGEGTDPFWSNSRVLHTELVDDESEDEVVRRHDEGCKGEDSGKESVSVSRRERTRLEIELLPSPSTLEAFRRSIGSKEGTNQGQ